MSDQPVALVVIDEEEGKERPGWALRAGDFIERTDYDHGRRVLEVHTAAQRPLPLWLRLRRWWEGHRRPDPDRLGTRTIPRFRAGGMIPGRGIPVKLADGERITTPERAEQLGLTADAKRTRREQRDR